MSQFTTSDNIRSLFSNAMSVMYGAEVPAYNTLINMVSEINRKTLAKCPELLHQLESSDNLDRITEERHGAIRLGSEKELHTMRRLFAVMGMYPVGYYDLSVAGIPVHSTAFRPIYRSNLSVNPFRVFTSLLRLDLIEDRVLAEEAKSILAKRDIFTDGVKSLINKYEQQGGLSEREAKQFVKEALETFRWHSKATVSADLYKRLHDTHRLVADVVSFKGPHINHLTPRTLDIDWVQRDMPKNGINPKVVVEGPPSRKCPILLRQTSFKALEEPVNFIGKGGELESGTHTARFGEIEQRGVALTPKGRALYDQLMYEVREKANADESISYEAILADTFTAFPDDENELRQQGLAYFEYHLKEDEAIKSHSSFDNMLAMGEIVATPIIYEDFLPVSAAGIFQSNLGDDGGQNFSANADLVTFEKALGISVINEFELYESIQQYSINAIKSKFTKCRR